MAAIGTASFGIVSADEEVDKNLYLPPDTNDSEEFRTSSNNLWCTESAYILMEGASNTFHHGVIDAAHDLGEWMQNWCAYVDTVFVNDFSRWGENYKLDEFPSGENNSDFYQHIYHELGSYRFSPSNVNLAMTCDPQVERLGCMTGYLYKYAHDDDSGGHHLNEVDNGTWGMVNSMHAWLEDITSYEYRYNMAIHEIFHGMFFGSRGSGGLHDHSQGDPQPTYLSAEPTVMATGYTHEVQQGADPTPLSTCDYSNWDHANYVPNPVPKITGCTARRIMDFHYGEDGLTSEAPYKDYVDISEIEGPLEAHD